MPLEATTVAALRTALRTRIEATTPDHTRTSGNEWQWRRKDKVEDVQGTTRGYYLDVKRTAEVLIDDWFLQAGLRPRVVMELGSIEAIKEMVAAGLGCSIVPSMAVKAAHHRRGLEVRPLAPDLSRTLGLVLRQDKPVGAGLRKVVEALEGLAQSRSGAPSGNSGR